MAKKTSNRRGGAAKNSRLSVLKTYKLYIGGKFPRTESGRYYKVVSADGRQVVDACRGTRKDLREAVVAARAALPGWSGASAYLRGQILYRIAEMMEGRSEQFVDELRSQGATRARAGAEVDAAIDRLVYYAGWCDKYQQVFSSVNPVASPHYNFSIQEPMGVVGVVAPDNSALLGLVSAVAPVIAGGNTCVVVAQEANPLCAMTWAEVLHASDVPGGTVNVLTGFAAELLPHVAKHKDINGIVHSLAAGEARSSLERDAAINIKRVIHRPEQDWRKSAAETPYWIADTQEVKTTWHPVGA